MLLSVEFLKNFSFCPLHLPKYSLGQNTRLLMLSSRDEQIDHQVENTKEAKTGSNYCKPTFLCVDFINFMIAQ